MRVVKKQRVTEPSNKEDCDIRKCHYCGYTFLGRGYYEIYRFCGMTCRDSYAFFIRNLGTSYITNEKDMMREV